MKIPSKGNLNTLERQGDPICTHPSYSGYLILYYHNLLFMHRHVNCDFLNDLHCAIFRLPTFVRWITSKEIHIANIPRWHQEIVDIFCMFEKEVSTSFMALQVHPPIHLVNQVELVGVVSCWWMFFLERSIKKVKGFV